MVLRAPQSATNIYKPSFLNTKNKPIPDTFPSQPSLILIDYLQVRTRPFLDSHRSLIIILLTSRREVVLMYPDYPQYIPIIFRLHPPCLLVKPPNLMVNSQFFTICHGETMVIPPCFSIFVPTCQMRVSRF